jgi:hypothetical protein
MCKKRKFCSKIVLINFKKLYLYFKNQNDGMVDMVDLESILLKGEGSSPSFDKFKAN